MITENGIPVVQFNNETTVTQQPVKAASRTLAEMIDTAVTNAAAQAEERAAANRISFKDVTNIIDHPEIRIVEQETLDHIPMYTGNLIEMPIQEEKVMEAVSQAAAPEVAPVVEELEQAITLTPAQEMVAQMFLEEDTTEHPIKEMQALKEMVAKMKTYATKAGQLASQPATGDFDLDAALQEELNYVLDRCEALTKEVNAAAEELVKNPPKEPEPKSELRVTVEDFFTRNTAKVQAYASYGYHRSREFIGMPVKPEPDPQQQLLNIQKSFIAMDDNLALACVATRKPFGKSAVPAL